MTTITSRRPASAAGLALLALAAAACTPFPGADDQGFGPSLVWVLNTTPAEYHETMNDGNGTFARELVRTTEPAFATCVTSGGYPLAGQCRSHYEGNGFAIIVPKECQDAYVTGPDDIVVPDLDLQVAGKSVKVPIGVGLNHIGPGAIVRNAVYVTVSGPGVLSTGMDLYTAGGHLFRSTKETTLRVPNQDTYTATLTCAVKRGANGWETKSYVGNVRHPSIMPEPIR